MASVKSTPVVEVAFDGTVYPNRRRVEISIGFDQILAEATIVCGMDLPDNVGLFTRVTITGGRSAASSVLRFTGRVTGFDENLYPTAITLHCGGQLIKAKHGKPKTKGGHKLHGKTGKQAVEFMLTEAGYDVSEYDIDTDDIVLGSTITDTDKDVRFLWKTDTSALDMVQLLDQASGDDDGAFRLHDFSPDGKVKRVKVKKTPKPIADFTFTQGIDIVMPTNLNVSRPYPTDQLIISAPKGITHTTTDLTGETPTDASPVSEVFSSPLIEHNLIVDGPGYSAEASSRFHDVQKKKNDVKLTLTTWRDDVILPNDTIAVFALSRLELSDKFVIQGVHLSWDENNHFLQQLDTMAPLGKRQLSSKSPVLWLVDVSGVPYLYDDSPAVTAAVAPASGSGWNYSLDRSPFADSELGYGVEHGVFSYTQEISLDGAQTYTTNPWTFSPVNVGGELANSIIRKSSSLSYFINARTPSGGNNGVFSSPDGVNWTRIVATVPVSSQHTRVYAAAGTTKVYFLRVTTGVYQLFDETGTPLTMPVAPAPTDTLMSEPPGDGQIRLVGSGAHVGTTALFLMRIGGVGMLWRVTPSGATDVTPTFVSSAGADQRLMTYSPDGNTWVGLHLDDVNGFGAFGTGGLGSADKIVRSTDGGITWNVVESWAQEAGPYHIVFNPGNPTHWYILVNRDGERKIYVSIDNGLTFTSLPGATGAAWQAIVPFGPYE